MQECVHTQSPKSCVPPEKEKNSGTFEDYAWEMRQNTPWCNFCLCKHEHTLWECEQCL